MSITDRNNLSLHGLPFDKMHFDFEQQKCELHFSEVDEERGEYIPILREMKYSKFKLISKKIPIALLF